MMTAEQIADAARRLFDAERTRIQVRVLVEDSLDLF